MDYWDSPRDGSVLSVDVSQVMVRVPQDPRAGFLEKLLAARAFFG